jgi:ribosomal protein S27AE
MEKPKCPYCGETMALHLNMGFYSYYCPLCYAEAPAANSFASAYATAMRRERKKGEWIEEPVSKWPHCSECGYNGLFSDIYETPIRSNFCPNCGADMRKEENDE